MEPPHPEELLRVDDIAVARAAPLAIRTVTPDDYDAVLALWEAAGLPFKPLGRDSRPAVAAELGRGLGAFLVAETTAEAVEPDRNGAGEARIVGVVFGTHDGRKGWINRLAVAPDSRGRGIARRLVREVERALRAQGIDVIAALVESENRGSATFFARMGYACDPEIEYFSTRQGPDS